MLVPLSWLADYVAIDRDADSLAAALTAAGLKVEAIHRPGADIEGVVVGEVQTIMPHPSADKLQMVEVTTGVPVRPLLSRPHNINVRHPAPLAAARPSTHAAAAASTARRDPPGISAG